MASKALVEKQIFEREGFRVTLELFEKRASLPPYDFDVMAPQRWRISDWKNARLESSRLIVRGATVYRGDGSAVPRDMPLGNLRDTYYEAVYGPIKRSDADPKPAETVSESRKRVPKISEV